MDRIPVDYASLNHQAVKHFSAVSTPLALEGSEKCELDPLADLTRRETFSLDIPEFDTIMSAQESDEKHSLLRAAGLRNTNSAKITSKEKLKIIKFLLERNISVNVGLNSTYRAAHLAALYLSPETFESFFKILSEKKQLDQLNEPGGEDQATPVHMAALHLDITEKSLQIIILSGFNFNSVDGHGRPVIFYAVSGKRNMSFLEQLKIRSNWVLEDFDKCNILHIAASQGTPSALQYSLDLDKTGEMINAPFIYTRPHFIILRTSKRNR